MSAITTKTKSYIQGGKKVNNMDTTSDQLIDRWAEMTAWIEKSSSEEIYCKLCHTGKMTSHTYRKHLRGLRHRSRMNEIRSSNQESRKYGTGDPLFLFNLDFIEYPKWKIILKSHMFDYLNSHKYSKDIQLRKLRSQLNKYEKMELSSLLELAIWKAKIISTAEFDSVQDMKEYVTLDQNFNPQTYANDLRMTCGCQVIIPQVMKFLY